MPNYSPSDPPLNLLKIGDKWINPAHIAAIRPGRDPVTEDIMALRVDLSGGRQIYLHDEEIDAMRNYLAWREHYNPESIVDLMWIWEGAKREDAERVASTGGLARVPQFVPQGDVVMRVDDSSSVPEHAIADPGPQNRRYFL